MKTLAKTSVELSERQREQALERFALEIDGTEAWKVAFSSMEYEMEYESNHTSRSLMAFHGDVSLTS